MEALYPPMKAWSSSTVEFLCPTSPISAPTETVTPFGSRSRMKPCDVATRSRELRDLRRLDPDGFLRKTFTLPVVEARAHLSGLFVFLRPHSLR